MDISFQSHDGLRLAGTRFGTQGNDGQVVLLLHGGGQTRHSWAGTADALAGAGHIAITIDQRGHGDSDWSEPGNYDFDDFADDVGTVLSRLKADFGKKPVVIGASLGGMASMINAGEGGGEDYGGLVLVDITPHVKSDGVDRILGFMAEHARDGFATLEEAAEVIAAYLPHRPKPKSLSGLRKNLRLGQDGRFRWHWDPNFLEARRKMDDRQGLQDRISGAAQNLKMPVLLVRGKDSELVGQAEAEQFLELVPHAKVADVSGARHMVAGDKNDVFTDAVLTFLD